MRGVTGVGRTVGSAGGGVAVEVAVAGGSAVQVGDGEGRTGVNAAAGRDGLTGARLWLNRPGAISTPQAMIERKINTGINHLIRRVISLKIGIG